MRQRRLKHEINVVPYIDVMLVLLIIFMVTAPMIPPAAIELPSVGKASAPPAEPIEILVKADGSLAMKDRLLGGAEVSVGRLELVEKIRAAQTKNPEQAVLIAGDKNARYEAVMAVLDELQRANVTKIGLLVQPKGERR